MNTNAQIILTILCFAALAAIPAFLPGDPEPTPPAFTDCPREQRLEVTVTSGYSFYHCRTDSTVWIDSVWTQPTRFEQRHINMQLKRVRK